MPSGWSAEIPFCFIISPVALSISGATIRTKGKEDSGNRKIQHESM
jgi:hypothetical protein